MLKTGITVTSIRQPILSRDSNWRQNTTLLLVLWGHPTPICCPTSAQTAPPKLVSSTWEAEPASLVQAATNILISQHRNANNVRLRNIITKHRHLAKPAQEVPYSMLAH